MLRSSIIVTVEFPLCTPKTKRCNMLYILLKLERLLGYSDKNHKNEFFSHQTPDDDQCRTFDDTSQSLDNMSQHVHASSLLIIMPIAIFHPGVPSETLSTLRHVYAHLRPSSIHVPFDDRMRLFSSLYVHPVFENSDCCSQAIRRWPIICLMNMADRK